VGGFSKVYLARGRADGAFYAAKFTEKVRIKDKEELIENERRINEEIAFPFLAQMKEFIETEEYFVMLLEYCPGGELFNLQRRVVRFEEEEAKKYFLEVLFAIEYLHEKDIIYRDLKPENIMLDVKGHIKIADFGLAKQTR
jgi:serum/glucocorticoid-regulated kinase 2